MHPNLEQFKRANSHDVSPIPHTEPTPQPQPQQQQQKPGSEKAARELTETATMEFSPPLSRWNQDILGDQYRMLSPRTGWTVSSPPAVGMPALSSPAVPCFATDHLPGPIMIGDDEQGEDIDLWLASTVDFDVTFGDSTWQQSPSPDAASRGSISTASTNKFSSMLPAELRPFDRRTLELVHFFFNNLTPALLSPTTTSEAGANPWRRLILPLTYGSEPLRSAVCAIARAHLETIGAVSERASEGYRRAAVKGLAAQMEDGLGDVATSLATTLLLVHHDSTASREMPVIMYHIRTAHKLLSLPRAGDDQVISFLEKVFHLYDVSTALSQGSEPVADSHAWNTILHNDSASPSSSSSNSTPASSPSSHASTTTTTRRTTPVDPIFGLTLTLFPILHRLAALRALTEQLHASIAANHTLKTAVLRAEHQSATTAIGTALERWYPLQRQQHNSNNNINNNTIAANQIPPSSSSISSSAGGGCWTLTPRTAVAYHHAMAHREAALVHIHRAVRGVPAQNVLVRDSALAALRHITAAMQCNSSARLPLWPLFVAACSLERGPDRLLATQTFQLMGQTAQAAAGKHLWSVVNSVWRRLDACEDGGDDLGGDPFTVWRDIGHSMGLLTFLA